LYAAKISNPKDIVNFDIEETDFLSDILYNNKEILLNCL
jgi:hypothetical protein